MRFRPNLLLDAWNLGEGLATVSTVLRESLFVLQASWRYMMLLKNILRELWTQLPILLGDSVNLQEGFYT
jgi:hypothetical protein